MITGKPTIIPFNKWMCTPNRWFILENIWKYYENWRLGGLGYPYFRKPPSVSEDLKTQTIPRSQPQRSSSERIATSGWYFTLPDDNSSLRYSFSMVLAAIFVYRTVSTFFFPTLWAHAPRISIQLQLLRPNRPRGVSAGAVHDLQPAVVCPQLVYFMGNPAKVDDNLRYLTWETSILYYFILYFILSSIIITAISGDFTPA